jgi:hypothetical protein
VLALAIATSPWPAATGPPREPYSCRLQRDEARKCAFGACDQRVIERLDRERLRDGGASIATPSPRPR